MAVQIVSIGDSLGIELPEGMVKSLHLEAGDLLSIHEFESGVELRPLSSLEARMARRVMREDRDVQKRLAES